VIHGGMLSHELRKQTGTGKHLIAHDPAKWPPVCRKDHAPLILGARPDAKPGPLLLVARVPLLDLKFLDERAAGGAGTSIQRH
jgi:hypothetical protein